MRRQSGDLWIFGYGSLIWRPGFAYLERRRARLDGRHRALCIYSVRYRGTPDRPGLVFGLDIGGTCEGVAFRVAAEQAEAVARYLRDREQVTGVYRCRWRPVALQGGGEVRALHFLADRDHPQYAGRLTLSEEAAIVRSAKGTAGTNSEYVLSTAAHLRELGIRDRRLERLVGLIGRHVSIAETLPSRPAPRFPPEPLLRCHHRRVLGF